MERVKGIEPSSQFRGVDSAEWEEWWVRNPIIHNPEIGEFEAKELWRACCGYAPSF
jgi:hypothetical protein